jgi:hypothetical protein
MSTTPTRNTLVEQVTIAWCLARTSNPDLTLRDAATFVCCFHHLASPHIIAEVAQTAHDALPASLGFVSRERTIRQLARLS